MHFVKRHNQNSFCVYKIAVLCLCLVSEITYSQEWYNDPETYDGVVILDDRSTVRGLLSYNQSEEYLLFEDKSRVRASDALYFQYYDGKEKFNRYFFSFSSENEYRFYEILLNGKLQLFSKSIWTEKSYIESGKSSTKMYIDKKQVETQLYIINNDSPSQLVNFEEQILPLLRDQIKAISNYILDNQLDINLTSDQFLIIDFYNDLFDKK